MNPALHLGRFEGGGRLRTARDMCVAAETVAAAASGMCVWSNHLGPSAGARAEITRMVGYQTPIVCVRDVDLLARRALDGCMSHGAVKGRSGTAYYGMLVC